MCVVVGVCDLQSNIYLSDYLSVNCAIFICRAASSISVFRMFACAAAADPKEVLPVPPCRQEEAPPTQAAELPGSFAVVR